MNWSLYKNFSAQEFACQCGCGKADMTPAFMEWLQHLRDLVDAPLAISSGYRCPDHNNAVSSTGFDGPHTTGEACDILVRGGQAHRLLQFAYGTDVKGVGVSQKGDHAKRFVHLDRCRSAMRPWVWSY